MTFRCSNGFRIALGLGTVLALAAGCSSGEEGNGDSATAEQALAFSGMYDVTYTVDSAVGMKPAADQVRTFRWAVRSHCGDDDPCTATVMTIDPVNADVPPRLWEFDLVDDAWVAVTEVGESTCTTGYGFEATAATTWDARTVRLDPAVADGGRFTGTIVGYSSEPCGQKLTRTVTGERTGDLDPALQLPDPAQLPPLVESPAARLTGAYSIEQTMQAAPSAGGLTPPQTFSGTFETVCLRDGSRCASTLVNDAWIRLYVYDGSEWVAEQTQVVPCDPSQPDLPATGTAETRNTLTRTDSGDGPAEELAGLTVVTMSGDCPGTFQAVDKATRTEE